MATVERTICGGIGCSLSFVLDDVAKNVTGLHIVNSTGASIHLIAIVNSVDISAVILNSTDHITPTALLAYNDSLPKIQVTGLGSIGLST